ncbi:MAG: histidine phosphatase family protein, partial [Kingella sp. (in: b-proteobacteria)]
MTTATKSSLHPETAPPRKPPDMKTLYLIRHAQSAANAGGISLPDREIPLSAEGARQAAELACRLPENRHVFVSEMRRTHETATPYCARHGVRPEILPCLNEFSYLPFAAVQGLDA